MSPPSRKPEPFGIGYEVGSDADPTPRMWFAEPYAVTRLDAMRKLRSEGYAVECVVCDVAHAGSCENCGKPMAEHGPMANCYPPKMPLAEVVERQDELADRFERHGEEDDRG